MFSRGNSRGILLIFDAIYIHINNITSLIVLHSRWTMDKRYQGVIRRRKSIKDRQNNGQKLPSLSYIDVPFLLPLGIFCPLFCLSFIDLRLLITPWYLLSIALSVLHWFTSSGKDKTMDKRYQGVIRRRKSMKDRQNNGQKIPRGNSLSFIDVPFLLPLGIFCPLFCLSFIDLRLLITLWYLLSIVLSVLHWFTPS
jgi:uncharacterized membrane protein